MSRGALADSDGRPLSWHRPLPSPPHPTPPLLSPSLPSQVLHSATSLVSVWRERSSRRGTFGSRGRISSAGHGPVSGAGCGHRRTEPFPGLGFRPLTPGSPPSRRARHPGGAERRRVESRAFGGTLVSDAEDRARLVRGCWIYAAAESRQ